MSPGWWGGGLGGEGPEKQTIPSPVLVASQTVPGRPGAVSLAQLSSAPLWEHRATGDRTA